MSSVNKWFRGLRLIWFVSAVVALGILWGIEHPIFQYHQQIQLLLRELAFALLISSVFGLTIEKIQRTEFIRLVTEERDELKRDVFLYAYGYNLPDQIREEIRKKALNSNFYRQNLTLDWEFSNPDQNDLMRVKKRYSYTLINNSDLPQAWPFRFVSIGADDPKGALESKFHTLKVRRKGGAITECTPAPQESQPHKRVFETSIQIAAHEEVFIHYEITHVRRPNGDDNYSSREMIVGITRVRLRFPEGSKFDASASCKQSALTNAPDGEPSTLYSFELTEGMFPHQALVIGWSRSEAITEGEKTTEGRKT